MPPSPYRVPTMRWRLPRSHGHPLHSPTIFSSPMWRQQAQPCHMINIKNNNIKPFLPTRPFIDRVVVHHTRTLSLLPPSFLSDSPFPCYPLPTNHGPLNPFESAGVEINNKTSMGETWWKGWSWNCWGGVMAWVMCGMGSSR